VSSTYFLLCEFAAKVAAIVEVDGDPKDQNNRRKYMPDYAVWEIHPVMKLNVQP